MKRWGLSLAAVATVSVVIVVAAAMRWQRSPDTLVMAGESRPPSSASRSVAASAGNPLRPAISSAMRDPFAMPASAVVAAESGSDAGTSEAAESNEPSRNAQSGAAPRPEVGRAETGPLLEPQRLAPAAQQGRRIEAYAPPQFSRSNGPGSTAVRPIARSEAGQQDEVSSGRRSAPAEVGETSRTVFDAGDPLPSARPMPIASATASSAPPSAAGTMADSTAPTGDPSSKDDDRSGLPIGDIPPMPIGPGAVRSSSPQEVQPPHGPIAPPVLVAPGSAAASEGVGEEGTGRPGGKQLEGLQTPQLQLQKFAPAEVQVGKPAVYRIAVRNVGPTPATGVEIRDTVPKGMRLLGTTPRATRGVNGEIVWTLGTLKPGDEVNVELQLMPLVEGEVGSTAAVHFAVEATARSVSTKPNLTIDVAGADQVLIGDRLMLQINVSNTGSGAASGVVIEAHLPAGVQHPAGADLEHEIGTLRPGETRRLELALAAVRPGPAIHLFGARGEGNLRAEARKQVEVTAPQLEISVEGPKKRYLEREAQYVISLHNPGTAPARKVELWAQLPAGLKFLGANNAGYYDEASRSVVWRLEELPVGETGSVELAAMPIEPGQHLLRLRAAAERGAAAEKEQPVLIEGLAAIHFQAADTVDPVEVNGETTYEIRVVNQGSKAAGNVGLTVHLPPELKPLAADGPSRYVIEGRQVVFEQLARLAPKADAVYRVRVQAVQPGDLRTRIQVTSDDLQAPVIKEESTRVYADE